MEMLLEIRMMMERGEISRTPEDGGKRGKREIVTIVKDVGRELARTGKVGTKEKPSQEAVSENEDDFFESD